MAHHFWLPWAAQIWPPILPSSTSPSPSASPAIRRGWQIFASACATCRSSTGWAIPWASRAAWKRPMSICCRASEATACLPEGQGAGNVSMTSTADRPLVSVFMFVRNGGKSLRRAVESVFAQTYPNIEFVVQDAVSTDGTLDLLRSYGDRIKIVSEPDSGPSEGLWRAMNRCTGEFVGSCLADEELLPNAVERAVRAFQPRPSTGAV